MLNDFHLPLLWRLIEVAKQNRKPFDFFERDPQLPAESYEKLEVFESADKMLASKMLLAKSSKYSSLLQEEIIRKKFS